MTLSRMIRFMSFVLIGVAAIPLYLSEAMPKMFWPIAVGGLIMAVIIASKTFSRTIETVLKVLVVVILLNLPWNTQTALHSGCNILIIV